MANAARWMAWALTISLALYKSAKDLLGRLVLGAPLRARLHADAGSEAFVYLQQSLTRLAAFLLVAGLRQRVVKEQFTPFRVRHGVVSRVTPVHTALRNCTRDEGRPFEVGNQVLISSHRKLL